MNNKTQIKTFYCQKSKDYSIFKCGKVLRCTDAKAHSLSILIAFFPHKMFIDI